MNDDHRADSLLICQTLGGLPDTVDVQAFGVDSAAMHVEVRRGDGGSQPAAVPFSSPVLERAQVGAAVVEAAASRAAEGRPTRRGRGTVAVSHGHDHAS